MKDRVEAAQLKEMLLCAYEALENNKQRINELNVFPVPDGDTGTNMTLTASAAAIELQKAEFQGIGEVADKAASAMLRGARGNSGVILSLLFRGMARSLKGKKTASGAEFAAAMSEGVDAAYNAVMKPAEGTILTVSRVATSAATEYAKSGGLPVYVLTSALAAARAALEKTVEQNPTLARAGVVDAGGMGYVVLLEAFLGSLKGEIVSGRIQPGIDTEENMDGHTDFSEFSSEEITFAYDTVFIVRKDGESKPLDLLQAYLDSIGDSLVISEDDEVFKVHVHTNIPGAALTEAQKYGTLETAKIENMRTQHDELVESRKKDAAAEDVAEPAAMQEPEFAAPEKDYGFVSVCAGEGLMQIFRELGCDRIVTGGQTMNPSTEDILREINRTPSETVFVLPNNKNIIMAAQQCIPLTEKKVIVVPTKTIPQGVTALLNLDTSAGADEITASLEDLFSSVHTIQVTYAARDSEFDGHKIKAGEYLGLMDSGLLGSWNSTKILAKQLCKAMKKLKPELITLYYGEDVTEAQAQDLANYITAAFPNAEFNLLYGGQPVYYYLISVE